MTRYLTVSCLLIAACFALPARADVTYEKTKDGDNDIEVIRMTVTPAAEPVPALRHRLLARDIDLKSGNAVPYYYRAQSELRPTMKRIREKFDEETELSLWYGTGRRGHADRQTAAGESAGSERHVRHRSTTNICAGIRA